MAKSRARNFADLIGVDAIVDDNNDLLASGTTAYDAISNLPTSGNSTGDTAFVSDNNKVYVWNGTGWYSIATVNQTPTWDSDGQPDSTYSVQTDGSGITITPLASDPDGFAITYSITTDSDFDAFAEITENSDGSYTVTKLSSATEAATGTVTFKASDGVNLLSNVSTFSLSFYTFQGSNYGYVSGGTPSRNDIQKYSYTSDANGTDSGDLTVGRYGPSGQSSTDYGYTSGGNGSPSNGTFDKFPFASGGNASSVGSLATAQYASIGQSSSDNGYVSGGSNSKNVIQKFSFSTDGNSSDVGDLTVGRYYGAGQSSSDYGYTSGGNLGPGLSNMSNVIDKFPFSSDANATDVGDMSMGVGYGVAGQSSSTYGYRSAGYNGGTRYNTIEKFPFSTDANMSDVGDLVQGTASTSGSSSTSYGYISGGLPVTNMIQKFSFSNDGNATDVGDLTLGVYYTTGQQY